MQSIDNTTSKIFRYYRERLKSIFQLYFFITPLTIFASFGMSKGELTTNHIILFFLTLLIFVVIYLKIFKTGSLALYIFSEILYWFILFFPFCIIPLIMLNYQLINPVILTVSLAMFITIFYIVLSFKKRYLKNYLSMNSGVKKQKKCMIDLENRLIHFERPEVYLKSDYKIAGIIFQSIFVFIFGSFIIVYFLGLPDSLLSRNIRSQFQLLMIGIIGSVFWILLPTLIALIHFKYKSFSILEQESDVSFKTSFLLVENYINNVNVIRMSNGLSKISTFRLFVSGDLNKLLRR